MKYRGLKREYDLSVTRCDKLHKPINDALERLQREKSQKAKWNGIDADRSVLRLVLFSPTGHGKSTLGNRILGDTSEDADQILKTSHRAKACTQSITHKLTDWPPKTGTHRLCLIDTPGWDESKEADRMHANKLVDYLRGAQFIHGLVLVKNQSTRFTQSEMELLATLEALVGDEMWQHVIFVMTRVEGRGGRPAKPERFDEWRDTLLDELNTKCKLSNVLRSTAKQVPPGITAGNRRSVRDIPVIGLSNFDETGGPFDYRKGISRLVAQLKSMGEWRFDSIVSPFDQSMKEFEKLYKDLAKKEADLNKILAEITRVEGIIRRHPEGGAACVGFRSKYVFKADHFGRQIRAIKEFIGGSTDSAAAHGDDEKSQYENSRDYY